MAGVGGAVAGTDPSAAVYVANDIVYYEAGKDFTYGEGSELSLAGLSIRVLETPGHTPGSVCLMTEDAIFSGDTLFEGDCGRTDLPGGNWLQMQNSLKRLGLLEGDYRVYPGHDVSTTLAHERKYNTSLKGAL